MASNSISIKLNPLNNSLKILYCLNKLIINMIFIHSVDFIIYSHNFLVINNVR